MSVADGAEYPRHPTHYHEDGNFILLINGYVFRIYKGLLARRSAVFADLFKSPQPNESNTSQQPPPLFFDGVSATVLTDDHETFSILLDLILPSAVYVSTDYAVEQIIALLLLCDKYEVEDIREVALGWIDELLPQNIVDIPNIKIVYSEPLTAIKVMRSTAVAEMQKYVPLAAYALLTHRWTNNAGKTGLAKLSSAHSQLHATISPEERFHFDYIRQRCEAEATNVIRRLANMDGMIIKSCPKAPKHCPSGGAFPLLKELLAKDVNQFPLEALDESINLDRGTIGCTNCHSVWMTIWINARASIFALVTEVFAGTTSVQEDEDNQDGDRSLVEGGVDT